MTREGTHMSLEYHRVVALPLWAVALCAVALAAPPRPLRLLTVLIGLALTGLAMMAAARWRRLTPRLIEVRPAIPGRSPRDIVVVATSVQTVSAADHPLTLENGAAVARHMPAAMMIPGARERSALTAVEPSAAVAPISEGPSSMDATTRAERRREGGGAPEYRQPAREPSPRGLGHAPRAWLAAARALFTRQVRTSHV